MKNAYAGYMLTSFFYTYLQALRSLFKMRIFFLPKSEQSCFLSEVCALHHYCVHQCRIAQFVYAKGTSLQVKSIDKKCLFFTHSCCYTRLTLQFRWVQAFFFISYSALYFNMGVHFFWLYSTKLITQTQWICYGKHMNNCLSIWVSSVVI